MTTFEKLEKIIEHFHGKKKDVYELIGTSAPSLNTWVEEKRIPEKSGAVKKVEQAYAKLFPDKTPKMVPIPEPVPEKKTDKLSFSISKNHYSGYRQVTIDKTWAALANHLTDSCVCPVTVLKDEDRLGKDDKPYTSKNYRAGRNIVARGNVAIIDFEGKQAKYDELIEKIKAKNL